MDVDRGGHSPTVSAAMDLEPPTSPTSEVSLAKGLDALLYPSRLDNRPLRRGFLSLSKYSSRTV